MRVEHPYVKDRSQTPAVCDALEKRLNKLWHDTLKIAGATHKYSYKTCKRLVGNVVQLREIASQYNYLRPIKSRVVNLMIVNARYPAIFVTTFGVEKILAKYLTYH